MPVLCLSWLDLPLVQESSRGRSSCIDSLIAVRLLRPVEFEPGLGVFEVTVLLGLIVVFLDYQLLDHFSLLGIDGVKRFNVTAAGSSIVCVGA